MTNCYASFGCAVVIIAMIYCIRRWLDGGRCHSNVRLDGKTVLITGANIGIGKETAIDLAKRGATVVMACRDASKGESALREIKERSESCNVFLKILDLASLASIREFSQSFLAEYSKLHILINNAGVMMCPYMKTQDGFEMQIGVNHFGHFALTNLLLQRIADSAPSRIVNVSSVAHSFFGARIAFNDINSFKGYDCIFAYKQSKLANVLFTKELQRKLNGTGVTTYTIHPGLIRTNLYRHKLFAKVFHLFVLPFIGKTVEQGAQTSIYCAVAEGTENLSGMYFSDCALHRSSKLSCDEGTARKLWDLSEDMTGVRFPSPILKNLLYSNAV